MGFVIQNTKVKPVKLNLVQHQLGLMEKQDLDTDMDTDTDVDTDTDLLQTAA